MLTTLQDRVKERMKATGLKNADLAKACNVQPPTSYNWASGKTKNIKGAPLLLAAQALGVTATWLATGRGTKFPEANKSVVNEPITGYFPPPSHDQYTLAAIAIFSSLKENQKEGALANLRTYVGNLGALRNGQALQMADKKNRA